MKAKRKYKKKRALSGTPQGKKAGAKITESIVQTGKDLLIGVIGGGIAGAVIGRPSLLIGIGVTGLGHFTKKPALSIFGIGMMAAGGFNAGANTTQGIEGFSADEVKMRVKSFKESLMAKLFLDKILKKNVEGINGVGAVQYYEYPNQNKELDFSALNNLEKQIIQSGAEYQKKLQGFENDTEEFAGSQVGNIQDDIDFATPSY